MTAIPLPTPSQLKPATFKAVIIEDVRLMAELFELHLINLGMEVAGLCFTWQNGLTAVRQVRPEFVLVDISLPDGDGLSIATTISNELPRTRILATSAYRDPWTMLRVKKSGVHGFVGKNDASSHLSLAVHELMSNRTFFDTLKNGVPPAPQKTNARVFHRILSDYEIHILSLIGACETNRAIAEKIGVSEFTIQSRRRDIMGKLDIHSTPELIKYALVNGLTRITHCHSDGKSSFQHAGVSIPV